MDKRVAAAESEHLKVFVSRDIPAGLVPSGGEIPLNFPSDVLSEIIHFVNKKHDFSQALKRRAFWASTRAGSQNSSTVTESFSPTCIKLRIFSASRACSILQDRQWLKLVGRTREEISERCGNLSLQEISERCGNLTFEEILERCGKLTPEEISEWGGKLSMSQMVSSLVVGVGEDVGHEGGPSLLRAFG